MGEVVVISLRNILYDRDGASNGNVMAEKVCGMKASSTFWYLMWSWLVLQGP